VKEKKNYSNKKPTKNRDENDIGCVCLFSKFLDTQSGIVPLEVAGFANTSVVIIIVIVIIWILIG
jgi:hypothetical protein